MCTILVKSILTAAKIAQNGLRHDFGTAIRTHSVQFSRFRNGNDGWDPIDGGRRGINESVAAVLFQYLRQKKRSADVVLVVCERYLIRFADRFVCLHDAVSVVPSFEEDRASEKRGIGVHLAGNPD